VSDRLLLRSVLRQSLRSMLAFTGTVAIGVLASTIRTHSHLHRPGLAFVFWVLVVVTVVAGALTVRFLAEDLGRLVTRATDVGAGAVVRLVTAGVGYLLLIFGAFWVMGVSLQRLLIGAGVAGVVLAVAAQQSLANVFAAVVLIIAHPFKVGDEVTLRSPAYGQLEACIVNIGLTYVSVTTADGDLRIPNSAMLASAIGRRPREV
jgi:small-conductance mechanosensitive channel